MPAINYMQTNFTGGQISPRLFGRIDLDRYQNGAEQIYNMLVHPHGGATRRSGFYHVNEVKNSEHNTILVRFEFSTTQAYILEFGDLYMRIYLNHGRLEVANVPVEVVTPYAHTELADLQWLQSNDVLYLFHKDYAVRKLERSDATTWTLSTIDFSDGPYLSLGQKSNGQITTNITLQTSAATVGTGRTLTASDDLFAPTDVGRKVRLKVGSNDWGYGKITAFTSATVVTWEILSAVGGTGADKNWRLGLYSETTGYPVSGTFHEQRLVLAGGKSFPSTVAFSVPGDFENMQPSDLDDTVADDSGMTYTLDTDTVNAVVWIKSGKRLRIGTVGQEFVIWSGSNDNPVNPSNIKADTESSYGSRMRVRSVVVGKNVLFVGRAGRKLREMVYVFDDDGFDAEDLTLLAEDITISNIEELAYTSNPDEIVWCRLGNGKLIGLTYVKKQEVIAWHEHDLGGNFGGSRAVVESIAVIPDPGGEYDELWAVVKRTINGTTKRYIEYLDRTFDEDITFANSRMLDSILEYSGASTQTISGLTHLEGETVRCITNGVDLGEYTVSAGSITVSRSVTSAYVGLMYVNKLRSLKFEGGSRQGVAQGRLTRAHEVTVRFNRTRGGSLGYEEGRLLEPIFERPAGPMGQLPELFTGDKIVNFPAGHELGLQVYVEQTEPLPMTILSIMPDFDVEEDV